MTHCINQTIGENFALYHGDSCQVLRGIPDNSIDYGIHSPPFESLYIYSDSVADLGNAKSSREFFRHYMYIIRELHRITVPGRVVDVHCKDLPAYFGSDGAAGLRDFPGAIIRAFERAGFQFASRVTIWKDPEIEAQRTNNSGLLYGILCKDSTCSRMGMADYLLSFRKWQGLEGLTGAKPVVSEQGFADRFHRYVGMNPPDPSDIAQRYGLRVPPRTSEGKWPAVNPFEPGTDAYRQWSIRVWRLYASPVWNDINQTRVLNVRIVKEDADEKHLCPLQLDVIDRGIHLRTNPGDTVLTPFAGVGSEVAQAVEHGRYGIGVELKEAYYRQAAATLQKIESRPAQRSFLDAA
jgi:DNA modification methylase